jgi:AraC family transcriptional regulator
MKDATTRRYHELLAGLIEQVLRCREGPIQAPELAEFTGFSRFHLARLFREATEETLDGFLRRMRLERAAFTLLTTQSSVLEVAVECGYASSEAFARAFRSAYGLLPTHYRRRSNRVWKLPSPSNLHWNEEFIGDPRACPCKVESSVIRMPSRSVAVWRVIGNYAHLAEGWRRLEAQYREHLPTEATFVTLYLDNMWTHPVVGTMRADLGWIVSASDPIPSGMRRRTIAAGSYAASAHFLPRDERNDAWSYMSGVWGPYRGEREGQVSYDEYRMWPLPFDTVETRIYVGLGDDAS